MVSFETLPAASIGNASLGILGAVGAIAAVSASSVILVVQKSSKKGLGFEDKGARSKYGASAAKRPTRQVPITGVYVKIGARREEWVVKARGCDLKHLFLGDPPQRIALVRRDQDLAETLKIKRGEEGSTRAAPWACKSWGEEGGTQVKQIAANKIEVLDLVGELMPLRLERRPPACQLLKLVSPLIILFAVAYVALHLKKHDTCIPIFISVAVGSIAIFLAKADVDMARLVGLLLCCFHSGAWRSFSLLTSAVPALLCFYDFLAQGGGWLSAGTGAACLLSLLLELAGLEALATLGRLVLGPLLAVTSGAFLHRAGDDNAFIPLLASSLDLCRGVQDRLEGEAAQMDGTGETLLSGSRARVEEISRLRPYEAEFRLRRFVEERIRASVRRAGRRAFETVEFVAGKMDTAMESVYDTINSGLEDLVTIMSSDAVWDSSPSQMAEYEIVFGSIRGSLLEVTTAISNVTREAEARLSALADKINELKDVLQADELVPIESYARRADVYSSNIRIMAEEARRAFINTDGDLSSELTRVPRLRATAGHLLREVARAKQNLTKLTRSFRSHVSAKYKLDSLQSEAIAKGAALTLACQSLELMEGMVHEQDLLGCLDEFMGVLEPHSSFMYSLQARLMHRSQSKAADSLGELLETISDYFGEAALRELHRGVLPLYEKAMEAVGVMEVSWEILSDILGVQVPEILQTLRALQEGIERVSQTVTLFQTHRLSLKDVCPGGSPQCTRASSPDGHVGTPVHRSGHVSPGDHSNPGAGHGQTPLAGPRTPHRWRPPAEGEPQRSQTLVLQVQEKMEVSPSDHSSPGAGHGRTPLAGPRTPHRWGPPAEGEPQRSQTLARQVQEKVEALVNHSLLVGMEHAEAICSNSISGMLLGMVKPSLRTVLEAVLGDRRWLTKEDALLGSVMPSEIVVPSEIVEKAPQLDDEKPAMKTVDIAANSFDDIATLSSDGGEDVARHVIRVRSPERSQIAEASTQLVCPKNHVLRRARCTSEYACDICGRTTGRGQSIMDCRVCNWGLCKQCEQDARPSSPAARVLTDVVPDIVVRMPSLRARSGSRASSREDSPPGALARRAARSGSRASSREDSPPVAPRGTRARLTPQPRPASASTRFSFAAAADGDRPESLASGWDLVVENEERPSSVERHVAGGRIRTVPGSRARSDASPESMGDGGFEVEQDQALGSQRQPVSGKSMTLHQPASDSPVRRPAAKARGERRTIMRRVPAAKARVTKPTPQLALGDVAF